MGKNDLARRMQEREDAALRRGLYIGMQYEHDMMQVALHTKLGFGYDRAKKLDDAVDEIKDYYADAFIRCMEQDIRQEQLDSVLRDLVKDRQEFHPFSERYPEINTLGYGRLPWSMRKEIKDG